MSQFSTETNMLHTYNIKIFLDTVGLDPGDQDVIYAEMSSEIIFGGKTVSNTTPISIPVNSAIVPPFNILDQEMTIEGATNLTVKVVEKDNVNGNPDDTIIDWTWPAPVLPYIDPYKRPSLSRYPFGLNRENPSQEPGYGGWVDVLVTRLR